MHKLEKGLCKSRHKQIVGVGLDLWLGEEEISLPAMILCIQSKLVGKGLPFAVPKFFLFARLNEAEVLCILEATKPHSMCDY